MAQQEPANILLVDDRPDKALAIAAILSELGQNVITVNSGKEALRILMNQDFALILLDVNMPGMDGFETASLIRKRQSSESTPIIFITSYFETETHMTRGYSLGAVDYILAPVVPEVLRAKVSVFVELYRKTREIKRQAEARIQLEREQAARLAAEDAVKRASFLTEVARLLASSLDYEKTLERVAWMAVPQIADWCVVDLLIEDGNIQRLAVAHADSAKIQLAYELNRLYPDSVDLSYGVPKVLRTCTSEIICNVSEEYLTKIAKDETHLQMLMARGLRSCMISPLTARDKILGAITFATAESGRTYGPVELTLAEDLARHAGMAIENARLYREAQQASRAKDEFLAVISHELRTPLTPILGWTRILATRATEPTMVHGIEVIERNVKAQAKLIEDLLDVSRIISGKLSLQIRSTDLVSIIEAAAETVRPAAQAREIKLNLHLDPAAARIDGDPDRLQQVVWNLLSNAIKFTPKGGQIDATLSPVNSNIQLQVSDSGIGIDPEFLPHVFERFRQADSTSTRAYGGLGLGLAIVRHLVELHGGSVKADSSGVNRGSTFTVLLPVASPHAKTQPAPPEETNGKSGDKNDSLSGLQVLVVDDEPDTRDLLMTILKQRGAGVLAVSSANEAMESIVRSCPDVLVSDIGMPEEDGYSLIKKVRVREPLLPAVALTAFAREEDRARALSAGYQMHISKPVDPAGLVNIIAQLAHNGSKS